MGMSIFLFLFFFFLFSLFFFGSRRQAYRLHIIHSLTDVLIEIQIWHLLRSMLWNPHCRFLDCEKTICQKWVFFPSPPCPPPPPKILFVWYGGDLYGD